MIADGGGCAPWRVGVLRGRQTASRTTTTAACDDRPMRAAPGHMRPPRSPLPAPHAAVSAACNVAPGPRRTRPRTRACTRAPGHPASAPTGPSIPSAAAILCVCQSRGQPTRPQGCRSDGRRHATIGATHRPSSRVARPSPWRPARPGWRALDPRPRAAWTPRRYRQGRPHRARTQQSPWPLRPRLGRRRDRTGCNWRTECRHGESLPLRSCSAGSSAASCWLPAMASGTSSKHAAHAWAEARSCIAALPPPLPQRRRGRTCAGSRRGRASCGGPGALGT